MGYHYENSNPERFQHFCQALLGQEFPKLQCFPVGQPDGGRDGADPESRSILQVKFKRSDEEENAEWLISALEAELPKIRRLVERGAEQYFIVTNARGTAHPDAGRIDQVQAWLDDNVAVPSMCLWRDDLDRRFDIAPTSLKLKYSELLSFQDGLDAVLALVLGDEHERQDRAIRAFIATQFEADATVKFKQVSLTNDLLDLFIDVPIGFPFTRSAPLARPAPENVEAFLEAWGGPGRALISDRDGLVQNVYAATESGVFNRINLGAAEMLLSSAAQDHLQRIVLEGAPGQGKSTLAQYVCQMHRARYLAKQELLERVSENYRQPAFRVPIKVDLRDYAAFLDGNSYFSKANQSSTQPLTLEVFLAELISYNAGGIEFSAYDYVSLLGNAPILLFLDGLDEVADIALRQRLVTSIGEALARWDELDGDVQVVVTSRPSVFGAAPSFGKLGFTTINLQNIDTARIEEYADKWVRARGLEDAESRDVKKILGEKLELAHIRDLTRNPMQLTILLSLIHQVGHSLPDQRTDLYTRYVDLFLTREADKSVPVRDHRAILLEFVQYLAWVLQTQAESSRSSGSISARDLQSMAQEFLRDGSHPVTIADNLFGGGLERIFVLVERIEGLYEFEVQPLREYFCARYLYSTAPVGTYRDKDLRGDRAQRFEALAASPFWLNVCRFYAGSCERGETGTLVFSLKEMIGNDDVAMSIHARHVGIALLQDWVFSNVKLAQTELIQAIFDDVGVRTLVGELKSLDDLRLDVDCGQDVLRERLFEELKGWPTGADDRRICYVLAVNGGEHLADQFLGMLEEVSGRDRTRQLVRMFVIGAEANLPPASVWDLIMADDPNRSELVLRTSALVSSANTHATEIQPLVETFVKDVLDGQVIEPMQSFRPLCIFADLLGQSSMVYFSSRQFDALTFEQKEGAVDYTPEGVRRFVSHSLEVQHPMNAVFDRRYSVELWASIVEAARAEFGETWASRSLAVRVAGMTGVKELPKDADDLYNEAIPLCARTRAARMRRGKEGWWLKQFELADSVLDRMLWLALVSTWSSAKNLFALCEQVNFITDDLAPDEFDAVRRSIHQAIWHTAIRADRRKLTSIDLRSFSSRAATLAAIAFRAPTGSLRFDSAESRREPLRSFLKLKHAHEELSGLPSWKDSEEALRWLTRVQTLRASGATISHHVARHMVDARLKVQEARGILVDPNPYVSELIPPAIGTVLRQYRAPALARVVEDQDWLFC